VFALWGGVSGVSGHETFGRGTRHQLDFSSQASSTFQGQTETMVKIMLKIVEW